ncbi:methylated-DNA--[protein]-cysteine S-methyltransferase [Shimazuella kribbensis]|uniref:methylated-DNA--[protein]-cysteine S-methyltransferase n=1 Tax=Shimazuella kribbensis TaxID=139808 RepID=UPI00048AB1E5|nr:methylated-DNA--[protein]-cysteine S-methyltransferase [Shimazuella kribbensis]
MNSQLENTNVYWALVSASFFDNRSFYIGATDKGLCRVMWPDDTFEELKDWITSNIKNPILIEDPKRINIYVEQIQEYLQGERRSFDIPLDMFGTEFRIKVWRALIDIPFGHTLSYADIANAIGNPKAVRAVGTANGANPIPIVVPCHRVIGKNKTLTGFGGGLTNKKKLLQLEGYHDYIDRGHARYQF